MVAAALLLAAAQAAGQIATRLVDQGIELSHRGRFAEAGELFVKALAADPTHAEAHYLLGLVRQQDGRLAAAAQSFRSALKFNPRFGPAQARLCELETREARARESGYSKAAATCTRAIAMEPADPEPHFHLGWLHTQAGNLPGAVSEFQTVLRMDPKYPKVKFELAQAHLDQQNAAAAIPLLEEVIRAEPANTNARFQLGSALVKKGDCAAAVPMLQSATESAQTFYMLAGCLKKLGRAAEAESAMVRVKDLRQDADARMQAKYRAAVAAQKLEAGKVDEAIAGYQAALALRRDSGIAVDLAVALLKRGRNTEVVDLLAADTSPLARYQTALALTGLGKHSDAAALLRRTVADTPAFFEGWYQLGAVLSAMGQPSDAAQALSTAVGLRPDEPAARLAYANVLDKLGRSADAAEQRRLGRVI